MTLNDDESLDEFSNKHCQLIKVDCMFHYETILIKENKEIIS